MRASTPPFTKPTGAYDARKLYDETSKTAAAQVTRLDPGNDALPSILADFRSVVRRLEAYAERLRVSRAEPAPKWSPQWLAEQGIPAESAYLASFSPNGSRIATPAEIEGLREVLTAEKLKGFGIGDVERRDVAETATTVATSQHPMAAEALRDHDERLNGPEDHL